MMTTSHVGKDTLVCDTTHFFRFAEGASGFIFFSGLVLGMLFYRRLSKGEILPAHLKLLKRASQLWLIHCFLTLGALAFNEATGKIGFLPRCEDLGGWGSTVWMTATLQFQPRYMDILPLYVVLLITAQPVLLFMRLGLTWIPVIACLAIYMVAQISRSLHPWGGGFVLGAWQLVFFLGLFIGYHRQLLARALTASHRRIILGTCLVIVTSILVLVLQDKFRFGSFRVVESRILGFLLGKPHMRLGRLSCSLSVIVLAHQLLSRFVENALPRLLSWLALMGRSSLYCFLVHLVITFAVHCMPTNTWPQWGIELVTAASIVVVYLMAKHRVLGHVIPN